MKDGSIYDIGQNVNGVSRFLYINNKWYYAMLLVFEYNYDESELTKTILEDDSDEVKLIGNIFDDNILRNSLDFSDCPEIISLVRNNKINDLLS
jgi:hypothetical protein